MKRTFHLVHHTHWDREWYHTAEEFRLRLVPLIDEIIAEAERDRNFCFLLDGQAVVIDDYLAVRPEQRDVLARIIARGQIEVGPWYVLADELIPSGEAQIRNLLAGRRAVGLLNLRPRSPRVLYCPDSFGHPATLPSLAAGFGCDLIILWRGFGGSRHPRSNCVIWKSPEGTGIPTYHLTRPGYELAANLPADLPAAKRRWTEICELLTERDRIGALLIPNGADHHALQSRHGEAIVALTAAAGDEKVLRSSLRQFAADVLRRSAQVDLLEVTGELRDSYGYTWTLQGTFSSRMSIKRMLARTSRELVRETEPWSALSFARGTSTTAAASLVNSAWKDVLLAMPHDTICGCSIDAVATAARERFLSAQRQGSGLARSAVQELMGYDPVHVRTKSSAHKSSELQDAVVVVNPAARTRGGVALIVVDSKLRDVRVGPGSARQPPRTSAVLPKPRFVLRNGDKSIALPSQEISDSERASMLESPRHYPDLDIVRERRFLVWIPAMPGYSARVVSGDGGKKAGPRPLLQHAVMADRPPQTISNGLLSAGVDKGTGKVFIRSEDGKFDAGVAIELERDDGDLYTPSLRGAPIRVETPTDVALETAGELRSTLLCNYKFSTAVENHVNSSNVTRPSRGKRPSRALEVVANHQNSLRLALTVDAGSPFVRLGVIGDNRLSNNRLRLHISGNIRTQLSVADAPLGIIERAPRKAMRRQQEMEMVLSNEPLHRHVTILGSDSAMTLFSDGSSEYECLRPGGIAITLLRSVGKLSRHDLPERPGNAGWPADTPEAQEHGEFTASFAIMPHAGGSWDAIADAVEQSADDFLHPMRGFTLRSCPQPLSEFDGVQLEGKGLSLSAIKRSDDGKGVILRCTNMTSRAVKGRWKLGFPVKQAWLVRLDETRVNSAPLATAGMREVSFSAPPRSTVSVYCKPGKSKAE